MTLWLVVYVIALNAVCAALVWFTGPRRWLSKTTVVKTQPATRTIDGSACTAVCLELKGDKVLAESWLSPEQAVYLGKELIRVGSADTEPMKQSSGGLG